MGNRLHQPETQPDSDQNHHHERPGSTRFGSLGANQQFACLLVLYSGLRLLNTPRVTRFPADCSKMASTCKGCPCRCNLTPRLRSSPVCRSSSKASNRRTCCAEVGVGILASGHSAKAYHNSCPAETGPQER